MAKDKKLTITIPAHAAFSLLPFDDNVDKQLALPLSSSMSLQLKPSNVDADEVPQDLETSQVYPTTDSIEQEHGYMPISDIEIVNELLSPGCPSSKMDSSVDHSTFINMDPSAFKSAEAHDRDERLPLPERLAVSRSLGGRHSESHTKILQGH
ncbi:hypothetical protein EDC04DRAFT_2808734, partial [Pisolithus marmoratus]